MNINTFKVLTLVLSLGLITACGGGGSSSSSSNGNNDNGNNGSYPVNPNPSNPSNPDASNPVPLPVVPQEKTCLETQYLENDVCINKISQQIVASDLNNLLVNNNYLFKPTTSAQRGVSVESLSPTICRIDGDDIVALSQGTCSLKLSNEGSTVYLPVSSTLSVSVSNPIAAEINHADIENCKAGTLSNDQKLDTLATLNEIRALHGLQPVKYDYTHDDEMMQTALVIAANKKLSHYPTKDMLCYSDLAYEGSGTSNLGYLHNTGNLLLDATNIVIGSITEEYSESIGHRRWLLSPFLTRVSVGALLNTTTHRFTQGAAIKVIYPEDLVKPTTTAPTLIAYPYHDYPTKYFAKGVPLSFSLLTNQWSSWDNKNVNYSDATVTVTERATGAVQKVTNIQFDNVGTGLPNSLQFNFDDLDYNRIYDVKISKVKVDNQYKDYNYWFNLKTQ